jgi:peptide/nickel transport system substrate-binding protein
MSPDHGSQTRTLLSQAVGHPVTRRSVLKGAVAGGLTAASLGSSSLTDRALAQTPEATRGGGGTLRILYWQSPTILNSHLANGTKDIDASRVVLEPLAEFDAEERMILILAAEEPTRENGLLAEDASSVTWRLKPGVKWHDGEEFTAEDVKFTWEYVTDPATAAITVGNYQTISSIDIVDDLTVKVNFEKPEPAWFNAFIGEGGMILPEHVFRDYIGAAANDAPANLMMIGTGPFKVSDFRPGDVGLFEINTEYHEPGKPFFDVVELKGGGDALSAARAVLQTGEADWATGVATDPQILTSFEAEGNGKLIIAPGGSTTLFELNHADPTVEHEGEFAHRDVPHPHFGMVGENELKIRQAVALALPRQAIVDQLYGPLAYTTASTMAVPRSAVPEDLTWEYNLEKAAALLDEAGAVDSDGDGIREYNGRPLRWVFQTLVDERSQRIQEIVKAALAELNIEVELKAIDVAVYFGADRSNPDSNRHFLADLQMYGNTPEGLFPIAYLMRYLSTDMAQMDNLWSGSNDTRYRNPEYDALWNEAAAETDIDRANELFKEMIRIAVNDVAEIALLATNSVSASSNSITGYDDPRSVWRPEFADIANWRRD